MLSEKMSFPAQLGSETVLLRLFPTLNEQRYRWQIDLHCNAYYDLHLILQGSCRVAVDGHVYELSAGQGIIIAPGRSHMPLSSSGEFEHLTFALTMDGGPVSQALEERIGDCALFPVAPEQFSLCRDLFYEHASDNLFRTTMLQAQMIQLLVHILRALRLPLPSAEAENQPDPFDRIDYIDWYFLCNYNKKGGQAALARQLHLSTRQLVRILQKHYGMTFQQKLTAARLDQARYLLASTNSRISEVAAAVGYTSEAAFYSAFRTNMGMTPRAYRQQKRRNTPLPPR